MLVPPSIHVSIRRLILVGGLVLGLLYALSLVVYQLQPSSRKTTFNEEARAQPGWLQIKVDVRSVDTQRDEATVRIDIDPQGTLKGRPAGSPAQELRLLVANDRGTQDYVFPAGVVMSPFEVTRGLPGDPGKYPFDHYTARVIIVPKDPSASLPMYVELRSSGRTVRVTPRLVPPLDDPGVEIETEITRTPTIRYFVLVAMLLMVALSVAVLAQSLALAFRGRKIEPTMFGYMTAMLFAFPALRNALPGVPPYGVLIDVLAFFWAEGIAAVALLIGLLAWLLRPYK